MNAGPGPLTLDLSLGTPDPDLLPDLGPALARVAGRPLPQGYLVDPVLPELAERLRDRWPFPPGHLSVVDGAMDALDRLTALTVRLGDVVLVEEAAFPPVLDLLDTVGAEVVPVAMDDEGMVPGALRAALARRPVAVYVQPRAHNPLGVSVSAATGGGPGRAARADRGLGVRGRPCRRHLHQPAGQRRPAPPGPDGPRPELLQVVRARPAPGRGRRARRTWSASWWPGACSAPAGPAASCKGCCWSSSADPATTETLARARNAYAERRRHLVDALAGGGRGDDGRGRHQPVGGGGRRAGRGVPPGRRGRRRRCRLTVRAWTAAPPRPHPRDVRAPAGRASTAWPGWWPRPPRPPARAPGPGSSGDYLGCMRMAPSRRMTSPFR